MRVVEDSRNDRGTSFLQAIKQNVNEQLFIITVRPP